MLNYSFKKKQLLVIVLCCLTSPIFSQIDIPMPLLLQKRSEYVQSRKQINGPAYIRTLPNGAKSYILYDYTDIIIGKKKDNWYEITVRCWVKLEDYINNSIQANSLLYDYKGKPIGKLLQDREASIRGI